MAKQLLGWGSRNVTNIKPRLSFECLFLLAASSAGLGCSVAPDEADEQVGSVSAEVQNGTLANSVAELRPVIGFIDQWLPEPRLPVCSGTLIRPRWVLTALHCVADVPGIDIHGAGRDLPCRPSTTGSWAAGQRICSGVDAVHYNVGASPMTDVALLHLSDDTLSNFVAGAAPPFVGIDQFDPEIYAQHFSNQSLTIAGHSKHQNADYSYTAPDLRQGTMRLHRSNLTAGGSIEGPALLLHALDKVPWPEQGYVGTGQVSAPGDSGGPVLGSLTFPRSVVGVGSGSESNATSSYARSKSVRSWIKSQIAATGQNHGPSFSSSSHLTTNLPENIFSGGTPAWSVVSGQLRQNNSVPRAMRLATEIYENFVAQVNVNSTDSDQSGIAFRFVDATHFYYATISERDRYFKIGKVDGSSETLLAQQIWTGDEANVHLIRVTVNMDRIQAELRNSSGTLIAQLNTQDSRFPVGKVGVYQDSNAPSFFDNFSVSHTTNETSYATDASPDIANHWTAWTDADNPTTNGGDDELVPANVCGGPAPTAVQARVVGTTNPMASAGGEVLYMTPSSGLRCLNADQSDAACQDYAVRFRCSRQPPVAKDTDQLSYLGPGFTTWTDDYTLNGTYVPLIESTSTSAAIPPDANSGYLRFNFTVPTTGDHHVWAKVSVTGNQNNHCPAPQGANTDHDSYWVRMDGGAWIKWNDIPQGTQWHWVRVHNSDAGGAAVTYNLNGSAHNLDFGYRECGIRLAKILVLPTTVPAPYAY